MAADITIVEALESFSIDLPNGSPFSVSRGDRFLATDPVVKGREAFFGELTVRSSTKPRHAASKGSTETATAAPGERRATTKPAPSSKPAETRKADDSA